MNASVDQAHAGGVQTGSSMAARRTNYRWILAFFAMLIYCLNYMDRVNLAVAAPAIMKELHFTKVQLGFFQTVFFVSYALFQVPWAALIENYGHRKLVPVSLASWSIFTAITPLCSSFGSWVVVRTLFGIGEAPAANGLNIAIGNWFPRSERGRAVGIMLVGSKIGPAIGIPAATMLMIHYGWRASFWVFGIVGVVVAVLYYIFITTYPHESRFVGKAELDYIQEGKSTGAITQKKALAPWGLFLRSPAFWCIGIQQGMSNFVIWVFLSWLPVYLLEAHHFSLKSMGFAAMIPETVYALGVFACGMATDYVLSSKIADSRAKTWFGGGGAFLSCICLYLTAISTGKVSTILWLSLALAFTGFSYNTAWTTSTDIGGRFAGTVAGWMQGLGSLIGAFAPIIVAWVVTGWGWKAGILVTAMSGILGGICWMFIHPERPLKGTELPEGASA